ncbi:MAG TPA: lysylphosphatidylglycerol synthase transmembrane domain-containing protein [Thermodesulfovibrionia bacterium]|nr:lysylphosphatidylglycerol synthase transmembrane domain-containing protein [Thermodesulfovibrionia bacterium]
MILPLVTMPLWIRNVGLTVGGVSLVLIGVCIILASNKGNRGSFLAKVLSKLPAGIEKKMQTLLNSFFVGIGMLRRWQNFAYIFLVSIFLWIQMIATIYILLWGYGLHINLALAAATTMIVSVFAVVIPSSPGYFGVLQLAFIFALSFFNVGKSDALAVSVIYHLTQYIPITIGGILFLFKEGLSFQSMAISAKEGCDIKTEQIKSC